MDDATLDLVGHSEDDFEGFRVGRFPKSVIGLVESIAVGDKSVDVDLAVFLRFDCFGEGTASRTNNVDFVDHDRGQ